MKKPKTRILLLAALAGIAGTYVHTWRTAVQTVRSHLDHVSVTEARLAGFFYWDVQVLDLREYHQCTIRLNASGQRIVGDPDCRRN